MKVFRWSVAATAAALTLSAAAAFAQTPMADPLDARDARRVDRMEKVVRELRSIVFQLRDTGKPVVVQPADTEPRLQELSERIRDLEQSLTRVNGQMESTAFELRQTKQANADLQAQVKSLSDRLATYEQAAAPPAEAPAAAAETPAPPPKASAGEAFTQARELMLAGDYDAAEGAFAAYVQAYPDSSRTPEARYWWGKTLAVKGAQAQAAQAYIAAIRGWPKTAWAPDAVVELARSMVALKKPADACAILSELPKRYPKAPAAVTARAAATTRQAKCGG
jgi:tol-pal system protein YbgF